MKNWFLVNPIVVAIITEFEATKTGKKSKIWTSNSNDSEKFFELLIQPLKIESTRMQLRIWVIIHILSSTIITNSFNKLNILKWNL